MTNSTHQQLINDIKIALEELLNTRKHYYFNIKRWPLVTKSILGYGCCDFSKMINGSQLTFATVEFEIKQAIEQFEPRVQHVSVHIEYSEQQQLFLTITVELKNTQNIALYLQSNALNTAHSIKLKGQENAANDFGLLSNRA